MYGLVAEQFFGLKESLHFYLSCFFAVRGVGDVYHHVGAKRGAECSRCRLFAISDAQHIAHLRDDIVTFEDECDDGYRTHEGLDLGIKWFVGNVRVVLAKQCRREADHLATTDCESSGFEFVDDFTAEFSFHGVRLEEYQSAIHTSGW